MPRVLEINDIDRLADMQHQWGGLLSQTAGASFFQSLHWLEVYWRHFGHDQLLRVLVVMDEDRPTGILPLVVRREHSRVGQIRVLTFPLHDWGSFYGPIGPNPGPTLAAGLEHIRRTQRDWDILELRWQGALGFDPVQSQAIMHAAGLQAYVTVWDHTAVVDLSGTWQSYWSARKSPWLRRFRNAESKLTKQGSLSYVRYRPLGSEHNDDSPRWDLYDACENIARRSWQGAATDGTTLSHECVRGFLHDVHETAVAAGAVDLNLLLIDDVPTAFIYNYHYRGYVSGLRRGYDAQCSRHGVGNVLLAYSLRDSFDRGDRIYDMGVGSLQSKRHFQTGLLPILRLSHFPLLPVRAQLLRVSRWWQSRRCRSGIPPLPSAAE
jgi:CelD/BcsL family acetyltransferase involved in cellulose biosynthesis